MIFPRRQTKTQEHVKTYAQTSTVSVLVFSYVQPRALQGTTDKAAMPHAWHPLREGPQSMFAAWIGLATAGLKWRLHKPERVHDDSKSVCIQCTVYDTVYSS